MELQRTIDGELVPCGPLPGDLVQCEDTGEQCERRNAYADCRGNYYTDDCNRHEADVAIVTEVLMGEDEWVTEYCTENQDYSAGYDCIIDDDRARWTYSVDEWVGDNYDGYDRLSTGDADRIVSLICEELDGASDCDLIYYDSDYASYSGPGCCIGSVSIDEYENQVDFDRHDELQELHDKGILDDVLDDVNCDAYVSRSRRREFINGKWEYVGRETYKTYRDDCDHLMTYHHPGGCWHWVVSDDRMDSALLAAIVQFLRENN